MRENNNSFNLILVKVNDGSNSSGVGPCVLAASCCVLLKAKFWQRIIYQTLACDISGHLGHEERQRGRLKKPESSYVKIRNNFRWHRADNNNVFDCSSSTL